GFGVGHVELSGRRDNDRLAVGVVTCSVTDATTAKITHLRTETEPLTAQTVVGAGGTGPRDSRPTQGQTPSPESSCATLTRTTIIPRLKSTSRTSSSLRRMTSRKPSSVSPTALTRWLGSWAFLESSSTTCCVPANSGR